MGGLILTGVRATSSIENEKKEEGCWLLMGWGGKWRQFMSQSSIISIKEKERSSLQIRAISKMGVFTEDKWKFNWKKKTNESIAG